MIRRILFYLNKSKEAAAQAAADCIKLCRDRDIEVCLFEEDAAWLDAHIREAVQGCKAVEKPVPGEIDLMIVFGGDGTVLRALDSYVSCDIPMLGVNLGRMGFLLETETQDIADALDRLKAGKYRIERRMMLRIEGECGGRKILAYATNEVSISRGLSQRMIALDA